MGQVRLAAHGDPEPDRQGRPVEVLDQGAATRGRGNPRRLTDRSASKPFRALNRSGSLHRFCQFDFPFSPGPADGRYLIRGHGDAADVIVVKTLGAPLKRERARPSLGRRRPAPVEPGDEQPEAVAVTRVTVIRGQSLEDQAAAGEWLASCRDTEVADPEITEALRLLNKAIQAHRVSAGDPYANDLSHAQARRVRIGFGTGDELMDDRWRDAQDVPRQRNRRGRRRMLEPEEQLARILGGRRSTYPSEDLLLRARLDLDQGRTRQAAMQARTARAALEAELVSDERSGEARGAVKGRADMLDDLATVALERELDEGQAARLAEVIVEMERIVRRRRHAVEDI